MDKKVRSFLNLVLACCLIILSACGPTKQTPVPATPTLSVAVNAGQAGGGPMIVAQTPLPGQRLNLLPEIVLVFDRDMDRQATSAAWSLTDPQGSAVPGQVVWKDARTFQFTPDGKLQPGSDYVGLFSTAAADSSGTPLGAEIRLEFRTVEALAVGQVFPADGARDVDPNTNISIVFNRPVIPLTIVEEQAGLPQPLEFSPQVAGQGEWVNSSMYIFKPGHPLDSGTSYSVRAAAGLADVDGNPLEEDFNWGFSTQVVTGFIEGTGLDNLRLDASIHVYFLQPMDPKSVAGALRVLNRETGQPVPLKSTWYGDNTALVIQPAWRYQIASYYSLKIDTSARAADGHALAQSIYQEFSTLPLPRIESVTPDPNTRPDSFKSWASIKFSSPMNLDSLKGRVKVIPAPVKFTWSYDQYQYRLNISGLEPATDYIVRLLPGMSDIYGNRISDEYSFRLQTANLDPYVRLLTPPTPLVYRAQGRQDIFLEYINLRSAQVQLYPLSFAEFASLNGKDADPANFTPRSEPVRTWQPDVENVFNRLVRIRLDFKGGDGNPLPPGYYFLGLQAEPFKRDSNFLQAASFIVATDTLTFKTTDTDAFAWLVDLETGAPSAQVPVVVYDENFAEIGRSTTGTDGVASLSGLNKPWYVRTDDGTRLAFASRDWGSGVSAEQFGIWSNYYAASAPRFAYVYTDRPLYRPGQDVYFAGAVRQDDDLHYSRYDGASVYVTIERDGAIVYSGPVALSSLDTFSGAFHLDDGAALGTYQVSVYAAKGDEKPFGGVSFRVAEYHKPEFQVLATPARAGVLAGDDYTVDLDASYYSGGAVGNAHVSWYTEASPFYFSPSDDFLAYNFSDWDWDTYWSDPEPRTPVVLDQGEVATDNQGHLSLTRLASLGQSKTSRQLQFYADVTDVSGNVVGVHTSLVVHRSELYPGIRSVQYIGQLGKKQDFQLAVVDWNSQPVGGQTVSVGIVERQWYSVQQQDAQGQVQWLTSVKDIPVSHIGRVVTDDQGKASVSFTPSAGGIYKAIVTVRDSKNHTQQASTFLWVAGEEYIPWRQTNDRSFNLVADQNTYSPGDTAGILIAQPFKQPVYALVTVERGHVYQHDVVRLEENSTIYRLPITIGMAPAAYVSVVVISGAQNAGAPDFKVGMTRLNVDTRQQTLDVRIQADRTSAGPGDQVTYTVRTLDASGKPVRAEVSLALVDKAVLALAPDNSLPILDAFYPVRALNVATTVGIVTSADDFNANYVEMPPEGERSGGGSEGKGVGVEGIVNVREYFRDTAFFEASVKTDADGIARVTVTLPENLTTWRMDARAVTADSLVGQATHELVSTKPMFVQLQTPRFFTAGDSARVGATVFNNTAGPLDVTVRLEAQGAELLSGASQTITVGGRQQGYITWDLRVAPGVERVDLTASASGGGYTDSSKPVLGMLQGAGIPVYSFHVTETVGTSGLLRQADSVTEAVALPTSIAFDDAQLSVQISPSLAASLQDGLTYLKDYPYSCMEQTASRLLSNLISRRILALSGSTDAGLQTELDAQIDIALQHIYAQQNSDGGWGWWGGYSDLLPSAYVVFALTEARRSGATFSQDVLERGIGYLQDNLPTLDDSSPSWQYDRQAFLIYVLANTGGSQADDAFALYDQRQRLSYYARAYLAQALDLYDPQGSRSTTLLSDLVGAAIPSAAGAHWEEDRQDAWNWNTDLRTTALVLRALIQIDPNNALTANAVRWLMAHRSVRGWGSTQETVWTLLALSDWLESSNEFDTNYTYALGLNNQLLQQGALDRSRLTETVTLQVTLAQMLKDQVNYLVIARGAGPGNLYYTAYLDAALPVADVAPLDQGIIVSRQYFRTGDDKHPVTEIGRGEIVGVRVTITAPESLHYVVVTDALPAGLEPIDASLQTDLQVPSVFTAQDYDRDGWGWWYFDHIELHDEKVILSATSLPAGTYVYTYLARASTAGTFNVIPVTAQEFYFPDVAGRGAGSQFVVQP